MITSLATSKESYIKRPMESHTANQSSKHTAYNCPYLLPFSTPTYTHNALNIVLRHNNKKQSEINPQL